jgi:hypothetical protein
MCFARVYRISLFTILRFFETHDEDEKICINWNLRHCLRLSKENEFHNTWLDSKYKFLAKKDLLSLLIFLHLLSHNFTHITCTRCMKKQFIYFNFFFRNLWDNIFGRMKKKRKLSTPCMNKIFFYNPKESEKFIRGSRKWLRRKFIINFMVS